MSIGVTFWQYRRLTDETRLRNYAEAWLRDFSGGEASIERVRLDVFHGLTLTGVNLAVPEQARFDVHDNSRSARTILRASALFLRLQPLSLITGRLVIPEVVAMDPEIRLVHRMSDGAGNWEMMFQNRKSGGPSGAIHLPIIRLRNMHLVQERLENGARIANRRQIIWADAQPLSDRPQVYDLKLTKVIESSAGQGPSGDRGRLQIDMTTLAIAGELPAMSVDEFLFAAPPDVQRWMRLLAMRGRVRPDALQYDNRSTGRLHLTLRDAGFAVPLDADEQKLGPGGRYLRFEHIGGTLQFDGGHARVELNGTFHDSPVILKGDLSIDRVNGDGLEAFGFDLSLTGRGVPLPRDDEYADSGEVRFVRKWKRLSNFVHDFDGIGPVDVAFQIRKLPGAGQSIEFIEGTMQPQGVSARYHAFPYRVDDLHGEVHFRPDGRVGIQLTGLHGNGRIFVEGVEGGYATQEADLRICGEDILLDDALRVCLSEMDQALCRRFNLEARMDIGLALTRADAPPGTPNNPWMPAVDVTFADGSLRFEKFPYPLDHLAGRLHIADGNFRIDELSAEHGPAKIYVNGLAGGSDLESSTLDLSLRASNVPFDDTLAQALPAATRDVYERFSPDGQFDLAGRLFTKSESGELDYNFIADLAGASLVVPSSSARLTDMKGSIHLRPDRLSTEALQARFAESDVQMNGELGMGVENAPFKFHINSSRLMMNERLRAALPPAWQAKYDDFSPRGNCKLDFQCASGPAEPQFTAAIEPMDVEAVFVAFPLPLQHIRGKILLNSNDVIIQQLTATHEAATISLSGQTKKGEGGTDVELVVQARDLELSETLRRAMPWRIKRQWNNLKPGGRIDLSFHRLACKLHDNEATDWQFDGQARLKNAALSVGCELDGVEGTIRAAGNIGSDLSIEGNLNLQRARVDGRVMTDVTADIARQVDQPVLRLENIVSRLCGGTLVGKVEVDYAPSRPQYGLSLTAKDVSLEEFLNAKLRPGESPLQLKGRVEGVLSMTGSIDDTASRRGTGHIVIREAQMLKVPLLLSILQVIHFSVDDNNAFHDAAVSYAVDGRDLLLNEIDLRGHALSMVGAGRVHTPSEELNLTLLVGSPLRLPRVEVLSEFIEGVARELMEVHVTGTLTRPEFRAEIVRSAKKALATIMNARPSTSAR